MDFDPPRRLRTSNSRNFSRPFPSPLSTGPGNTPTRPAKVKELHTGLPLSESHGNMIRHVIAQDSLATNRVLDFVNTQQNGHSVADVPHEIGAATWNVTSSNELSPSSRGSMASSYSADRHSVNQDLGTTAPIMNFRAHLWRLLERDREVLNLDLFWPVRPDEINELEIEQDQADFEDENPPIFPYESLKPLLTFCNLRSLHLTGMMQSYQPLIWATCWLNPNLTTLRLEMSLEPLMNVSADIQHRHINASWSLKTTPDSNGEAEYLGHHGTGALHEEFGDGEYLDTQAINVARQDMIDEIPSSNTHHLPIQNLTLMNFVIDAWSIRWFDPKKFEEIVFKPGCIDAGFHLPFSMMHVKVQHPTPPVGVARVVKPGELKIVELKRGNVISRKDAVMASPKKQEEVNTPTKAMTSSPSSAHSSLRHKFSQLMPQGAMARRVSIRRGKNKHGNTDKGKENKSALKNGVVEEGSDKGEGKGKKDDNIPAVDDDHGTGKDNAGESGFTQKEVRAAKDGKKAAR